jgi:hypothetical protein
VPNDPNTLLTRTQTAHALTEAGYPTSPATLATRASRGGGPPFQKYGPRAIYRWGSSLAWAKGRLSDPVHTTSELHTARQVGLSAMPPLDAASDPHAAGARRNLRSIARKAESRSARMQFRKRDEP